MKTLAQLKTKIFADGADRTGMLEMYGKPYISGLTTNPTLIEAEPAYSTFAPCNGKTVGLSPERICKQARISLNLCAPGLSLNWLSKDSLLEADL